MVFACVTFLSPAKSEDRKSGEGKTDTNLTNFLSTDAAPGTPTRRHALGRLPTPPPLPENLLLRLHKKLPSAPLRAQLASPTLLGVVVGQNSARADSGIMVDQTERAAKEKPTPISQFF